MKQECLEMNKMDPARSSNLPPTLFSKTATATTSVSSFIFLSPLTIFQSHSWYAWSCLPQSSQHWSEIKEQPSVSIAQQLLMHCKEVHLGRAGYGAGAGTGADMATGGHQYVCSWQVTHGVFCGQVPDRVAPRSLSFQKQLWLSVAFQLLLHSCFESKDARCIHFPWPEKLLVMHLSWHPLLTSMHYYYSHRYIWTAKGGEKTFSDTVKFQPAGMNVWNKSQVTVSCQRFKSRKCCGKKVNEPCASSLIWNDVTAWAMSVPLFLFTCCHCTGRWVR